MTQLRGVKRLRTTCSALENASSECCESVLDADLQEK